MPAIPSTNANCAPSKSRSALPAFDVLAAVAAVIDGMSLPDAVEDVFKEVAVWLRVLSICVITSVVAPVDRGL